MGLEIVETVIYLTNIIICAIIAVLMTDAWQRGGHRAAMLYWMIAAWVMLGADVLFAVRPLLPYVVARILPTLLVTVGQATLFIGARLNAEEAAPRRLVGAIIAAHAVALVTCFLIDPETPWRRMGNGITWASLAVMSYACLRRSSPVFWQSYTAPAKVFMAHAVFHVVRLVFSFVPLDDPTSPTSTFIEIIGDLEVSFFMVALFVGLLIANLTQRNQQLTTALTEVQTLSGLLPICAWCKKVRDDDGYWQQVDHYFRSRSQIRFSHGMCTDCADTFRKESLELDPRR